MAKTDQYFACIAADEGRGFYLTDKPRYHLATKIMSNGVEVIVAGDKSTLPGMPSVRIKPTALNKPITLAPSTVTDHMMMLLPQETQVPRYFLFIFIIVNLFIELS